MWMVAKKMKGRMPECPRYKINDQVAPREGRVDTKACLPDGLVTTEEQKIEHSIPPETPHVAALTTNIHLKGLQAQILCVSV